jgi:hypothetical protein
MITYSELVARYFPRRTAENKEELSEIKRFPSFEPGTFRKQRKNLATQL